jgi:hypothetical protein
LELEFFKKLQCQNFEKIMSQVIICLTYTKCGGGIVSALTATKLFLAYGDDVHIAEISSKHTFSHLL